jgi:hypothetical protein
MTRFSRKKLNKEARRMTEDQISEYIEYWMEGDKNFSKVLSDPNELVDEVEHYNDNDMPRVCVFMNTNLILLFPPFQIGFNYSEIEY